MPRQSALLTELTETIGYGPTIELVRAWGGRRLSVPASIEEDHPIALALGAEPADRLATFCGGTRLEIPVERNALLELRNDKITQELAQGETTRAVAERYGLTARHVRHIRDQMAKQAEGAQ